jgi:hypothetical protein
MFGLKMCALLSTSVARAARRTCCMKESSVGGRSFSIVDLLLRNLYSRSSSRPELVISSLLYLYTKRICLVENICSNFKALWIFGIVFQRRNINLLAARHPRFLASEIWITGGISTPKTVDEGQGTTSGRSQRSCNLVDGQIMFPCSHPHFR